MSRLSELDDARFKADPAYARQFIEELPPEEKAQLSTFFAENREQSIRDYAMSTYGYLGWYLDEPEIGPILRQAAEEQWSAERLQGQLTQTNWWRTTSASARQWDYMLETDPATAQRQVEQRTTALSMQARRVGANVSSAQITSMANDSLRFGWSEDEAMQALMSHVTFATMTQGSAIHGAMSEIQELAGKYMVSLTDNSAFGYAKGIAEGTMTLEGVEAILKERALAKFPHLSQQIEDGTLGALFADYQQLIGSYLGVHPSTIDLETDPRWSMVLGGPDTGIMPQQDLIRQLRGTNEFRSTERGRAEEADLSRTILEGFGAASF